MGEHSPNKVFQRTTRSPVWEGVVFPGLEKEDDRAKVYEAAIPETLKPFIQAIWFMIWDISEGHTLRGIGTPIPCVKLTATAGNDHGVQIPSYGFLSPKDKGVFLSFGGQGQSVGIDFKPGGIYPFLNDSFTGWQGFWMPGQEVVSGLPALPAGSSWDLSSAEIWYQDITKFFESKVTHLRSHHLELITKAAEVMWSAENISIDELAEKVATSARTLQRVFQSEVGLSVKETLRIVRFNKALRAINGQPTQKLVDFALESGYFDQAHMSAEFKKLVRESPAIFRKFW